MQLGLSAGVLLLAEQHAPPAVELQQGAAASQLHERRTLAQYTARCSQLAPTLTAAAAATCLRCRDVHTGTALTSFKSNACPPNGLTALGRDYLVAAQLGRGGGLHFWAWQKDQLHQRCFAAEQLTAVAATRDGVFCAAGGSSGAVFVWETSSGRLLRTWPGHYKVRAGAAGWLVVQLGWCEGGEGYSPGSMNS